MKDVIIIGAGVTGCTIARELSRYNLDILLLEKANDLSCGITKANSGIVHAGFDCKPGSVKAKMNLAGAKIIKRLSKPLGFRYKNNGAFVLCFNIDDMPALYALREKGEKNGVEGLQILDGDEIRKREPFVSAKVVAGLWAPTSAIISPWDMAWALAENAADNGVKFLFEREVRNIERSCYGFSVSVKGGETFTAKAVVNAAGIHADEINNFICKRKYRIIPRKGEYILLDKNAGGTAAATLFRLPSAMGKGVLVTPTVDGNLLLGPTANDVWDREDVSTTAAALAEVFEKACKTVPTLLRRDIIVQYSGLRPHIAEDDFVVEESEPYFFNALAIESPGLSSAPAIGAYLANKIAKRLNAIKKQNFISKRKGIPCFAEADSKTRKKLYAGDRRYGHVVCRCENVTEAEIIRSLRCRIPAADLDGVKRRTRAQAGRCQSGFCAPLIMELIAAERNIPLTAVTKAGGGSNVLVGKNKEL